MYGSECWTANKETEKKLEAVEMWFIRRMTRISWTKKSNEYVLKEANLERSLIKTIRQSPQQGNLGISGPPSGQGTAGGDRTRDRRFPADLRADSLSTVPPTPQ
ncbi:RNA-directed DNA polymerase from mobile element jockey [Plakobranchus ocellatus]|uniref:RNA-directed DNA polymerase from mobile element jockey n=1 Tax=Plakobranchus ocellatus TaxID=259542 RepID=A0AAV3ZH77_9GAST|nr:RNA-directed DNA polymerase from mobile element jockey [Plakobranchus ocellatus]